MLTPFNTFHSIYLASVDYLYNTLKKIMKAEIRIETEQWRIKQTSSIVCFVFFIIILR